jgi:hypothetical protein
MAEIKQLISDAIFAGFLRIATAVHNGKANVMAHNQLAGDPSSNTIYLSILSGGWLLLFSTRPLHVDKGRVRDSIRTSPHIIFNCFTSVLL